MIQNSGGERGGGERGVVMFYTQSMMNKSIMLNLLMDGKRVKHEVTKLTGSSGIYLPNIDNLPTSDLLCLACQNHH